MLIEELLISLAKNRINYERLNRLIGEEISASISAQNYTGGSNIPVDYLELAYEWKRCDEDNFYYQHHDGDIEAYLSSKCQHALNAHRLIQERKEARKQYGIAKARVTRLSNRLYQGHLDQPKNQLN